MITPQQQQKLDSLTQSAGFTPPPQTSNAWSAFDKLTQNQTQPAPQQQSQDSGGEGFLQKSLIDPLKGGVNNVKKIVGNVANDFKETGQDIGQSFNDAASGKQSAVSAGLQATGDVTKLAVSPITETVNQGVNDVANKASDVPSVQDFANSKIGNALSSAANIPADKYSAWAIAHPEASKNLEAIGNIAQAATMVEAPEAGNVAKTGLDAVADTAKSGLNKVKSVASDVGDKASDIKGAASSKLQDKYVKGAKEDWAKPTTVAKPAYNKATQIFKNAAENDHDIADTLVKNKISLSDNVEDGKYQTADTAEKIRTDAGQMSNDLLRPSLEKASAGVSNTPIDEITKQSVKDIEKSKGITPGDRKAQIAKAQAEGEALKEKYPKGMSLVDMHDEKINYAKNGGYKPVGTVDDNNTASMNRSFGRTLANQVETKAPSEVPVSEFNKELSKQYQAADYLDALNNKKAPASLGQKLRQGAAKVVGAKVGSVLGGGIMGGVAGYHIGGTLEAMLENLPNPIKNHFLENLETTNPEAFGKISEFLKNGKVNPVQKIVPADLREAKINPRKMIKINNFQQPEALKFIPQKP